MIVAPRRNVRSVFGCSLFALLLGACGASDDGDSVPPFEGAITPANAGPGGNPPGGNANPPAAVGNQSPTSNSEQPAELALKPPAADDGKSGAVGETPTTDPSTPPGNVPPGNVPPGNVPPGNLPPGNVPPALPPSEIEGLPTRGTANLFTQLLAIPEADVENKVRTAVNRVFGIGTAESTTPQANAGFRLYYELPQDRSKAFIWAADVNEVRSEGQSYGMMIAVQMDMQTEFDKLWKFAQEEMQFNTNDAWNNYFRWQGQVTASANNITVNFGQNGPAPDGDEYFAAALYLADRRWGSAGGVNYEQEADAIASSMLHNPGVRGGKTALIDPQSNMVVFFPQGNSATFSDPSYHLPAFYEIFAQDGDPADSNRWRQVAQTSRQFFVTTANGTTGLHPDYANFAGTPNTGGTGQTHDQFRFDAWRVVMNMAVDYAWGSSDPRLKTQVEKYHQFFGSRLGQNNVRNGLYLLNGNVAADDSGSSTALTATLASGALISGAANRAEFVDNLWNVGQQSGTYRYYQESVYLLGLLATSGRFGYDWTPAP
jgi:oligosaccharide reducing-end xylanase